MYEESTAKKTAPAGEAGRQGVFLSVTEPFSADVPPSSLCTAVTARSHAL
jgi:hypothetical protein